MLDSKWRALQNEAQLAAEQIAHGVSLLGKACYSQQGRYSQAFFCLSIGLERAGKIIFIANYAIQNSGKFPTDKLLKDNFGHNLESLLDYAESVGRNLNPKRMFPDRPNDLIHRGIEQTISKFSTKLRYYNLNHLSGQAEDNTNPINLWWELVATPIFKRHYSLKQQRKNAQLSALMEDILGNDTHVMQGTETGEHLDSIYKCFSHSCTTKVVQKYSQFYTLQLARWLASTIRELSFYGAYELRLEAILGIEEPFNIFFNEDSMLRSRRTWSIYNP